MLRDGFVGQERLRDDEELVVADKLGEEEIHPVLDDLLENHELRLHERVAEDFHDLLLLSTLVARRVEEDHAFDG